MLPSSPTIISPTPNSKGNQALNTLADVAGSNFPLFTMCTDSSIPTSNNKDQNQQQLQLQGQQVQAAQRDFNEKLNCTSSYGSSTTMTSLVTKTPDTTHKNPNRRSNKPIMEKRRRARINNCLNELKSILLESMKKDPARHSKLEKADILELTVSHLRTIHGRSSTAMNSTSNYNNNGIGTAASIQKFHEGFSECISEVGRFLSRIKLDSAQAEVSGRLLSYLTEYLESTIQQEQFPLTQSSSVISLMPSRLPSGEVVFVIPKNGFNSSTQAKTAQSQSDSHHHDQYLQSRYPNPMLSPEVPLELTISPSTSLSAAPHSQWSARYEPYNIPYSMSASAYKYPNVKSSRFQENGHGGALSLVKGRRLEPSCSNRNCWRPW